VNRTMTLLLSLALLAGGVLLVLETVLVALNQPALLIDRQNWYRTLSGTRLSDPVMLAITSFAALLGLLILVAQLRRWAPDRVATPLGDGWHLHRRSLENRLAAAVDSVPGVDAASARLRRHRGHWAARIHAVGDASSRETVERTVRQELERLSAPPAQEIQVELVAKHRAR
jgi:hypothetical protein